MVILLVEEHKQLRQWMILSTDKAYPSQMVDDLVYLILARVNWTGVH